MSAMRQDPVPDEEIKKEDGHLEFFIVPILILSSMLFNITIPAVLLLAVAIFAVFMMTYPHMMELSNENEHMY